MGRTLLDTIGELVTWAIATWTRSMPPGPPTTPGTRPNRLARMSQQTGPDNPKPAESEAEAADRLLHGSSFGAAAAAYAEHRPGYAEARSGGRWSRCGTASRSGSPTSGLAPAS